MDKLKFMKWAFVLTAIASAIVFIIVGIKSPVEPGMSLFGHILKTIFGWLFVTVILETLVFSIGQIAYHWVSDNKDEYGKAWFVEGVKSDLRYVKEKLTWKKLLRYIVIYVAVFSIFFIFVEIIELFVP